MERRFISHKSNSRLILIFMGWGMDATPVASLAKPGYDILVVSDYTGFGCADMACLEKTAEKYGEIVVIAWSFGVRIAAEFLRQAKGKLPITRTVAVNGTTTHIDDTRGIPVTIFNGTLNSADACLPTPPLSPRFRNQSRHEHLKVFRPNSRHLQASLPSQQTRRNGIWPSEEQPTPFFP